VARARAALDEVYDADEPAPVVLVSHDAVIRLLLASVGPHFGPSDEIPQRTACWNVLGHVKGRWQVEFVDAKVP
jgi:broad specificity phosphatase PhoE